MRISMLVNNSLPTFIVPALRFNEEELKPYMSSDTIHFHYHKHTKSYFNETNKMVASLSNDVIKKHKITDLQSLIKFLSSTDDKDFFNQAAQAWNHAFFWENLTPKDRTGEPSLLLLKQFEENFYGLDSFKQKFKQACLNHFGSGWCWLIYENNNLSIETTSNADTPIIYNNKTPLLVCDLWEHAYYLDTQNNKRNYIENFWNVIDWKVVNERFNDARTRTRTK